MIKDIERFEALNSYDVLKPKRNGSLTTGKKLEKAICSGSIKILHNLACEGWSVPLYELLDYYYEHKLIEEIEALILHGIVVKDPMILFICYDFCIEKEGLKKILGDRLLCAYRTIQKLYDKS